MGKLSYSKIVIFFAIALLGVAAAIAAVAVLSSPATAHNHGGGGDSDDYPWDTDNLRYGSYNAKSFNIPFHKYSGYSGVAACQKNVADGFFQTDNSVVNDFPVLVSSGSGDSITWSIAAGSAGNDAGCDTFVAQQDRLAEQVAAGLTYALTEDGKVGVVGGAAFTTGRSVSDLSYVTWTAKASSDYTIVGTHGATRDISYLRRADGIYNHRRLAITPHSAGNTITVPSGASTGNFGAAWHASRSNQLVGGVYSYHYKVALYPSLARHLTKTKSDDLCIGDFHPRGEDSYQRIGGNTGRSLTGLSHAAGRTADRFWCRSDVRYERRFKAEHHTGVTEAQRHPQARNMDAGTVFSAYGRLGCYYTATSGKTITGTTASKCDYYFPLPKCDPNPSNGSDSDWRNYTNREMQSSRLYGKIFTKADGDPCAPQCTHHGTKRDMTNAEISEYTKDNPLFAPNTDGTTPCVKSADPQQAGFTADPCVTASLVIGENRIVGSDAVPGVPASDRTLAVATGRTAWDLDITSPHHNTASPPRDTASTPADATGCADGSESRADHSSDAGSAARKNTAAGVDLTLPASSVASESTHPPHSKGFDSAGTDYSGAVKNIAHRYASNVAENTCAAKETEAELVLALGKARSDMFSRAASDSDLGGYAARYAADVESNRKLFSNASPKGYKEKLEAVVVDNSVHRGYWLSWFNTNKTALISRATDKKTAADDFKSALDTARANHKRTTDAVALRSFSSGSCVAHWNAEIARIAGLFSSADSVFSAAIATSKRAYHNSYDSYVKATFSATTAAPTSSESVRRSNPFYVTAISITSYYCNQGEGSLQGTRCQRPPTTTQIKVTIYANLRQNCINFINAAEGMSATEKANLIRELCLPLSTWGPNGYRYETETTTYPSTAAHKNYSRSAARTVTYTTTGAYKGATNPISSSCPITISIAWTSEESQPAWPQGGGCTPGKSQAARYYEAVGASPTLPSAPTRLAAASYPSAPAAVPAHKAALLGKYDPANTARNNLNNTTASTRDTAAANLGTLTSATAGAATKTSFAASAVTAPYGLTASRTTVEAEAGDYQTAYTGAYDTAYTQATTDMGTTATTTTWNNFDWRYHSPSLAWGGYQEDPATTYSASTATPRDGTGCDLITVASDGTVSVEATRLDYETSSYGKSSVYSTRTDAQRTCKIRRTRTPELLLEYQPSRPSGTDASKVVSFFYIDYQPTPAAERLKLYDEAEVFAVKASLADSPPVLCYQPGEALVAHVAAKGIDAVNKAVFRNASGFAGGSKKHCYRHPSGAQLVSNGKSQPAFVFFDDTAHSAMASVNVVWQQPNPKIVSKLGSADDLKMMANSVALEASNAVAYADATRTSSFYGTYYTFPTDISVKSPSGWDITGHPSLTLTSTFNQHQVQAKDTAAKTPTTHTMVFKFIDCVFGIEDVAFVDNIASPYALLSDENGVVPSGWKQTYDRDPHNSPTCFLPQVPSSF